LLSGGWTERKYTHFLKRSKYSGSVLCGNRGEHFLRGAMDNYMTR
jgi:hypothetical protein